MTPPPLWERQPHEQLQLFLYKTIYIKEIKKANKELKDVIIYIENLPKSEKDGSCRQYKGHLIKIPTLIQLQKASAKWCWRQADEDYTNHLLELDNQRREENYHKSVDTTDDLIDVMFDIAKESAEELQSSDYKTSTKIQLNYTLSRTLDLLNKNRRLNHGRPTTISKADVDVEAEVNYGNFDNLIEAFDASQKEWEKFKNK